ncbi:MAG: DUF5615 family PIN-like protein [Terriglobia bacterium]
MKFLANMGISPRTVAFLRDFGHEAVRLPEIGMDRASDMEVIALASREGQVVLTFDLDYPALLALNVKGRASAIVFRTTKADATWINSRLEQFLPMIESALLEGAIVVVEDDRARIRRFVDL